MARPCSRPAKGNNIAYRFLLLIQRRALARRFFYISSGSLVYPNPTTGKVFVELSTDAAYCTLDVINASGQRIKTQKLTAPLSEVDLSGEANGLYFIRIFDCNGKILGHARLALMQ